MKGRISEATKELTRSVHRAEAGENIRPLSQRRIVPTATETSTATTRLIIEQIVAEASGNLSVGPDAGRCQDFLYDDRGLPATTTVGNDFSKTDIVAAR